MLQVLVFCILTVPGPVDVHYENTPIQYTTNFHGCKNHNFQMKSCDIFLIFA